MSGSWISRSAVEAPLTLKDAIDSLGRAVWLYLHLLKIANPPPIVLRTVERLAEELALPEQTIEEWLRRLSESRLIRLESPPPFLVIKLLSWLNSGDSTSESLGSPSGLNGHSHSEVPVSSSKQQAAAAALQQTGEGGTGEGEALLNEVAQALDGADREEVRSLIGEFPKPVVLKALIRVKSTPSSQIRKSKLALFRYLLSKFSANPHAH
jgi:hypothetical protein